MPFSEKLSLRFFKKKKIINEFLGFYVKISATFILLGRKIVSRLRRKLLRFDFITDLKEARISDIFKYG